MNNTPIAISDYLDTVLSPHRPFSYLQLDSQFHIVSSGGDLAVSVVPTVGSPKPVTHELEFLSGILPVRGTPLVLLNTQIEEHFFIDIHIFEKESFQWVLLLDNTVAGLELQADQQVRLTDDILRESEHKDG